MNKNAVDRPILLIGTHRSGTTWLGRSLGASQDVAYWVEPRHVWAYRNWFRPDDSLDESHASDSVVKYIRERFLQFTNAAGKTRFCEKTPSNCLRIPFIQRVFPDARYIFLIRDGRAVFRSTQEIQQGGIGWGRVGQRIRETSWRDLPAFADRLPWMFRKLTGRPLKFWGVRPPGWKEWLKSDSPAVMVAKQWAASITAADEAFASVPPEQVFRIRYEDLTSGDEESLQKMRDMLEFAELSDGSRIAEQLRCSNAQRGEEKWKAEISDKLLEEIRPHLEPTLARFGYRW